MDAQTQILIDKMKQTEVTLKRICDLIPEGEERDCPDDLTVMVAIAHGVPYTTKQTHDDHKASITLTLEKKVAVKLTSKGPVLYRQA